MKVAKHMMSYTQNICIAQRMQAKRIGMLFWIYSFNVLLFKWLFSETSYYTGYNIVLQWSTGNCGIPVKTFHHTVV